MSRVHPQIAGLRRVLTQFINFAGEREWRKRIAHLRREVDASPFRAKLAVDYNWLELIVADQLQEAHRPLPSPEPAELAVCRFIETVVRVHGQLNPNGRRQLEGRLRDALKSTTGFAPLYLEMDVSQRLVEAGFNVEFADLDGSARYDLRFWRGDTEGEVECKSLSADAGRKIHRHDFYRFVDAIGDELTNRVKALVREAIVVTLNRRLPSDDANQHELRTAARTVLRNSRLSHVNGTFFSLSREDCSRVFLRNDAPPTNSDELYRRFRQEYGDNCHVSGPVLGDQCCVVVMRSNEEDDHSEPELVAMRKAASQFSGTRPAFVAVQYDDIAISDLARPNVRERSSFLSYILFTKDQASHVVATCFSAYGGMVDGKYGTGVPAFAVPNPTGQFRVLPSDYNLFLAGISNEEFARVVGAPASNGDISHISLSRDTNRKRR